MLKQDLPHHQSRESITSAANHGCYICGIITKSEAWKAFDVDDSFKSTWYLEALSGSLSGWLNLTIDAVGMEASSSEQSDGSEEVSGTIEPIETGVLIEQTESGVVQSSPPVPIWGFAIQPAKGKHLLRRVLNQTQV